MAPIDREGHAVLALLRERMNRLFDAGEELTEARLASPFSPPTDVYTTDDQVVVTVELPGLTLHEIEVDTDADHLVVRGQRAFRDGDEYHLLERSHGAFACRVNLPGGANPTTRRTSLADGVLKVEMQRSARS
jgi:HSP20 family protein